MARHGDAVGTKGKFHGMMDTPLTTEGMSEANDLADELAKALKGQKVQAVYTSPLSRTIASAKPIAERLGVPLIPNKALLPLDLGDYVGKDTEKYRGQVKQILSQPNQKFPNGESPNKWAGRYIPFINQFLFKQSPEVVIMMTHGRNIILTKADMKLGNNPAWDKSELMNAHTSTEHGGYAVADGTKNSFQIITPKGVPAGQS